VKPLDEMVLRSLFGQKRAVLTIEEHALAGGFGSAVAEWVGDHGYEGRAQLIRLGAGDCYLHEAGEQEYARHVYGISSARIVMALGKF
jgi:1-deoxy-D-xylulose-5-phosphate synthase